MFKGQAEESLQQALRQGAGQREGHKDDQGRDY